MKKINRWHVLLFFIIFSVLYFWVLKWILFSLYATEKDNLFEELGEVIEHIPQFIGAYTILLTVLSLGGIYLSRRRNNWEIYLGFFYAFLYSLLLIIGGLIIILEEIL